MFILKFITNNNYNNYTNEIEINSNITIGRGKDNNLVIDKSTISKYHAKIYYNNGKLEIEDLHSINGTYIDNTKIEPETLYQLYNNQILSFADVSYLVKEVPNIELDTKKNEFIIGRDPHSDIFIDNETVSFHHIRMVKENDEWYIIDNNSTNGTYLNSYDNRITKIELQRDQVLYLSTYKLYTNEIYDLVNNKVINESLLNNEVTLIGRNPNADIYIDNLNVSWNHAKIIKEDNGYYIYDLNSTNGTFVNGEKIQGKAYIQPNDKITVAVYSFLFRENKEDRLSILLDRKGFTINVENISFKVKDKRGGKTLLDDVSFTVYSSEIVGIMGLSGAGKTTLLKILSGYTLPTEGKIYVNGLDLYKNFELIKNSIGYVPQEDVLYPELTVYESLLYAFKLRMKENLSKKEIDNRIDQILDNLALPLNIKHVKIGSPDDKGISGGQRKRVNIAMELLADPEIIFLDEPTSGLSSVDAKIVMEKLKELSNKGKTIILTIHQPSLINYKMMDNMTILTNGKLAYYGPNYPDSIKFFNEEFDEETLNDPDMALLGLYKGEEKKVDWKNRYKSSEYFQKFVKERNKQKKSNISFDKDIKTSALKQFTTLVSRYIKIKIKDKINTAILLLQAPIIAFLLVFLFLNKNYEPSQFLIEHPSVLLFILVISSIWFGIINSVKEIVSEKAIFERERLIGLKIIPYIMSKFVVLSLISLFQVIILIGIVAFFGLLKVNLFNLMVLIYITSLVGVSIGLLVSALAKSVSQALSLVPLILLPMIVFGGGMMPIKDMPNNKFKVDAYHVSMLMPTRWSVEEAIRIFDKGDDNSSVPLREPLLENKKLKYKNKEVALVSEREDPTCEKRRCIESLYIKKPIDLNGEIIYRVTSTLVIYIFLFIYILVSIVGVFIILYRRYKK